MEEQAFSELFQLLKLFLQTAVQMIMQNNEGHKGRTWREKGAKSIPTSDHRIKNHRTIKLERTFKVIKSNPSTISRDIFN